MLDVRKGQTLFVASSNHIRIYGAREHNLKNIDVAIPRGALTVITGISGSGKSSLAFDTLHAEGQRRYVESLSVHARQFMEQLHKPAVDRIEGLCPTIAIQQRATSAGPRSTVATSTEIYDFLRVLYARVGQPRCWICQRPIVRQTTAEIVNAVLSGPSGQRVMVLAPMVGGQRGTHTTLLAGIIQRGFIRARINDEIVMLEDLAPLATSRKHTIDIVVDRLTIKPEIASRLADDIETATRLSGGRVMISAQTSTDQWSDEVYSAALVCPDHPDVRIGQQNPQLFSFNTPEGACDTCHGLGTTMEFDPELLISDERAPLSSAIAFGKYSGPKNAALQDALVQEFCQRFNVKPTTTTANLSDEQKKILLHGSSPEQEQQFGGPFIGVIAFLKNRWESTDSQSVKKGLHELLDESPCATCHGARLNQAALCVRLNGQRISESVAMTVADALGFFKNLTFDEEHQVIAAPILTEINHRLAFMCEVGVGYLTLDRSSATLSGGEWQRIRLATQIGGRLAGVCYVLDEPTVGLHPRDSRKLIRILGELAELDNTVVVVEHDEEVIAKADYLIDMGPGAGDAGGYVVAAGTPAEVLANSASSTAEYLSGRLSIPVPTERRPRRPDQVVQLQGVSANNLKEIDVRFPLGCFICVTGVSGSGKSTLVSQVLLRVLRRHINRSGPRPGAFRRVSGSALIDRVIDVDQSPIGRSPRSAPATYVGVFDLIRKLYAQTREAKIRGYSAARFSFNIKGGRCEHCEGQGVRRISMHFLPDVFVTCGTCHGQRFNRETLEIRYRGKSIADALNMSVDEAVGFYENFANIRQRVRALNDVGLGYMSLGQSSNTLSGGEAQRVKLASELHKSADGHTMYILDEPTTGLHFADVRNLLTVLNRLVDRGDTVVVIEHNLDVIACADWIIDLGPEGGHAGGQVVACGTPEEIVACTASHTGRYLTGRLKGAAPMALRAEAPKPA